MVEFWRSMLQKCDTVLYDFGQITPSKLNAVQKLRYSNDTNSEGFAFPACDELLESLRTALKGYQDAGIKYHAHLFFSGIWG